eukprot:1822709-Pyramimonas_sp.AAC.1
MRWRMSRCRCGASRALHCERSSRPDYGLYHRSGACHILIAGAFRVAGGKVASQARGLRKFLDRCPIRRGEEGLAM